MNTDLPQPIGDLAAQIVAKAQRAYDAHAAFRDQPSPPPAAVKITGGFPLRAIQALPSMRSPALSVAKRLLPQILGDATLLIYGKTGRGKTVMATWFEAQRLIAGRRPGLFLDARDLFARLQQCWVRKEDTEAVTRKWRNAPFLVLDEMQSRSENAWENTELDHLINKRYAALLPTVLIGNFADETAAQESLGPRIIDRIRETGHLVPCEWASYRA